MTPQSTFMIAATVRVGKLKNLRTLLAMMNKTPGHADSDNSLVSFSIPRFKPPALAGQL